MSKYIEITATILKHLGGVMALSGVFVNLAACSPYVSWKEEVKLNDGRVIVVEQKKRAEGGIARESWLTIPLPEFGPKPVVWHEYLNPRILNVDHGVLYVVGSPPTTREIRFYNCPAHQVVGFVWQGGLWHRISFEMIPESIYNTNMLIENFPAKETSFLTIAEKESRENNGKPSLRYFLKLDPQRGAACQ